MRGLIRRALVVTGAVVVSGAAVSLAGPGVALASTLTVTNCSSSGTGSLPDAVASAAAGDTIIFNPTLSCPPATPIALTSTLAINQDLTITGPGAATMAVSGGGSSGVLDITSGTADISGLTIEQGSSGGINLEEGTALTFTDSTVSDNPGANTGGIVARPGGDVTLSDSTVTGNGGAGIVELGGDVTLTGSTVSGNAGSGIQTKVGTVTLTGSTVSGNGLGGIDSDLASVTLTDSTVSGNTTSINGGGINNGSSPLTLTDSTVSGNTTSINGGGIYNGSGDVTLTDSTVSGNTASSDGGGIYNADGTVNAGGTIVAGNTNGTDPNCANPGNGTYASAGYNLTNDATGTSCGFTQQSDVVGDDPLLGPLADNGGPTETMLPLPSSPAVVAIPSGTTLNGVSVCPRSDQRGVQSVAGAACTIGAVEVSTITVTVSGSQAYGGSPAFTQTSNAPSGVTLDTKNLVCTTADQGSALSSLPVGSHTLDGSSCSGASAPNYQIGYAGAAGGFAVGKGSQTISFTSAAPPGAVVAGPTYTPAATGGASGEPVVFSVDPSSTAAACSLGNGVVSFTGAGACVIDANQPGNADYDAAAQVQQSITVGKGTPVISWAKPAAITWGTPLSAAQLDATASVPGTFSYTPPPGTVPGPGTGQPLSASFQPTDTANYTGATAGVTIDVVFSPAACITGSYRGPLVIGNGQAYCVQRGATITNGVTVKAGGALYLTGGTIKGSVSASGASALTVCGVTLSGGLTITGATGPLATGTCGKNTIAGSVAITGNSGGLTYQNNTVSGSLTITNNTGGFGALSGNKTTGSVTMKNNT